MTELIERLRERVAALDPAENSAWRDIPSLRRLVQHELKMEGHLSPGSFGAVLDWKLRKQRQRTEKHRNRTTPELIQQITSRFIQVAHEDERTA